MVISPVVEVRLLDPDLDLSPYAAVIFTSENAVAAVTPGDGRPAWCVGDRTTTAARAAGWDARSGNGDASGLAKAIQAHGSPGPMIHLRGREAAADLAGELTAAGIPCDARVVYEQATVPLTEEAMGLLSGPDPLLVPLFSANSARRLASSAAAAVAPLRIAAMSPAVLAAWDGPVPQATRVAAIPDADSMIDALVALADSP